MRLARPRAVLGARLTPARSTSTWCPPGSCAWSSRCPSCSSACCTGRPPGPSACHRPRKKPPLCDILVLFKLQSYSRKTVLRNITLPLGWCLAVSCRCGTPDGILGGIWTILGRILVLSRVAISYSRILRYPGPYPVPYHGRISVLSCSWTLELQTW